ncbi:unnamed protein product [Closterium sp. Naga37s-1]|nr:unnamed protein product [Closterium sp. Naga37s-1]
MSPELTPDGAVAALGTAASQENAEECAAVLARLGRSADSLPADLADAIARGRVPGAVVERYAEMENTVVLGYLMRFGGFKERLLADDLFMTKVAIECGIGICTKTSAELERRRGAFFPEFDFVIADVIMALIADFMLVWLPAPTIPLHPALAKEATALQKFLDTCPDNAFQVPVRGTEYTLLQRFMAVLRNGAKLMVVGTTASLFGCGMTNALQWVRRELAAPPAAAAATIPSLDLTAAASFPLDSSAELAATLNPAAAIDAATTAALVLDPSVAADVAAAVSASAADVAAALATAAEVATAAAGTIPPDLEVPILATSLAYGSYAAISANLRWDVMEGRGQHPQGCAVDAGFIGSNLVKLLLDRGYHVRGTVRDATNEDKTSWIRDLAEGTPGKLELFSADLGKPGSFDEAVEGCEFVCHVASLVRMSVPNPQSVVDAALEGTRNVFSSILKHKTAKKVVVTSSVAAIIDYVNNKDHLLQGEGTIRENSTFLAMVRMDMGTEVTGHGDMGTEVTGHGDMGTEVTGHGDMGTEVTGHGDMGTEVTGHGDMGTEVTGHGDMGTEVTGHGDMGTEVTGHGDMGTEVTGHGDMGTEVTVNWETCMWAERDVQSISKGVVCSRTCRNMAVARSGNLRGRVAIPEEDEEY